MVTFIKLCTFLLVLVTLREAGDVWCLPPVLNLRAVIWFHFAISSLVLLPSPVTLFLSYPFSVLFVSAVLSSKLFPENSSIFFVKRWTFFNFLFFYMAPVWQLREVSRSVVCAACCRMALVFAVMHLYNIYIYFFYCFCPFLFLYFKKIWYW